MAKLVVGPLMLRLHNGGGGNTINGNIMTMVMVKVMVASSYDDNGNSSGPCYNDCGVVYESSCL